MNVCIVGGTGHIGCNLVSMFLEDSAQVTVISSGRRPVPSDSAWDSVRFVTARYGDDGWEECLEQLKPDVFVDILGSDAPRTYAAVKSSCTHFILCGSVWMFGEPRVVPTPEVTQNPARSEGYAKRYAQMLELKKVAAADGIPFTAIMPPNICGPGKIPIDGWGGRDAGKHKSHQRGEPVPLPAPGNTLIGPCDAWDVAQGFYLSAQQKDRAADHIFNIGSAYALTAKQMIEAYGVIYGVEIPITWHSWEEYSTTISPEPGAHYHFEAHMCPDLTSIRNRLGYKARYTPEETMRRGVAWMQAEGLLS